MYLKLISYNIELIPALGKVNSFPVSIPMHTAEYPLIKGSHPACIYPIHLANMFNDTPIYSPEEFIEKYVPNVAVAENTEEAFKYIASIFHFQNINLKNRLWIYDALTPSKQFNWIDSFYKKHYEGACSSTAQLLENMTKTYRLWSALVKMKDAAGQVGYLLNTMDTLTSSLLKNICISYIDGQEYTPIAESPEQAYKRNTIFLDFLKKLDSKLSMQELIKLSVFSGTCFTAQQLDVVVNNLKSITLSIDDSDCFITQAHKANQLAFVFDDNGETVFDLAIIKRILEKNKHTKIILFVNKYRVGPNVNTEELLKILSDECFSTISSAIDNGQVVIAEQSTYYEALTEKEIDDQGIDLLRNSDFIYIKGQMFYEAFDVENIGNAYYAFVSSDSSNTQYTGLRKGEGCFAFVPKGTQRYIIDNERKNVIKTLKVSRNIIG